MKHFTQFILSHLDSLGNGAYWVLFVISFAESTAFVGLLIPSTSILMFAGFLAEQHILNFWLLSIIVTLGMMLGDSVSFYLGRRGATWFQPGNKIFKLEYLEKGEAFFKKHGSKSVIFAHFISPLRPTIPFVAGLLRMRARIFFILDFLSAYPAACLYLGLGYFFGHAAGQAKKTIGKTGWAIIAMILLMVLWYFFKRYLIRYGQQIFAGIRMVFAPLVRIFFEHHARLQRFIQKRKLSRLSLTFVVSMSLALVLGILEVTKIAALLFDPQMLGSVDFRLDQWLFAHRHPVVAQVLYVVTTLGSTKVVAVLVVIISIFLFRYRKCVHAVSLWVGMGGAVAMVWFTKHWILRPRPVGISFYTETGFSFPSGHAMGAAVLYGWFVFYVFAQTNSWSRKMNVLFFSATMMVVMSFTRLYLGVHYLSDVIAGLIIGLIWLGVGIGVEKMWVRRKLRLEKAKLPQS